MGVGAISEGKTVKSNNAIDTDAKTGVGRRRVVQGAAWSVPAISMLAATPAYAVTGDVIAITAVSLGTAPSIIANVTVAAPNNRTINRSNPNSTVTVSGTATPNRTLTVTAGATTLTTTSTAGGTWTVTFTAAQIPQAVDLVFTATITQGRPVSTTSAPPLSVTKDTVAPAPAPTIAVTKLNGNSGNGQLTGTAAAAAPATTTTTAIIAPPTVVLETAPAGSTTTVSTVTQTGTAWSATYTKNGGGNVTPGTYTFRVTQRDGAGNVSTATASTTY